MSEAILDADGVPMGRRGHYALQIHVVCVLKLYCTRCDRSFNECPPSWDTERIRHLPRAQIAVQAYRDGWREVDGALLCPEHAEDPEG